VDQLFQVLDQGDLRRRVGRGRYGDRGDKAASLRATVISVGTGTSEGDVHDPHW